MKRREGMREQVHKLLVSATILILSGCFVFGQEPKATPQTSKMKTLLSKQKDQLERLNNALLGEKARLSSGERIFMFANLAEIWKGENLAVAKNYLKKAVDQASLFLTNDPKQRTQELGWLRGLIPLSGQIDSSITEQIMSQLKAESEAQPSQSLQNSVALTEASLVLIASNPKLAFDMAIAALGYLEKPSQNEKLYYVIVSLVGKDKKLAEELLLRVFKFAQDTSDLQSIGRLALFTSPNSHNVELDFLSDNSRKYVLTGFLGDLTRLSALFRQGQLTPEQKEQACVLLSVGKRLDGMVSAYLPNESHLVSEVSQQSNFCQQASSSSNRESVFDEIATSKKDSTIDDLVRAGKDSSDVIEKAFYFTLAVSKLSKEKKFERALELLDDMDEPTRKSMGTGTDDSFWRATRQANALNAVLQKVEAKDLAAANRIIEKTPSSLRPALQIQVSRDLLAKVVKIDSSDPDQSFAFVLISEARQRLPAMDDPFSSVNLYLSLVRRYAVLLPDQVPLVFQEMMKAINRADNAKGEKEYKGKDFVNGEDIISLPVSLLDNEEIILSHIAEVQRPYSRVRLKLGLLKASMTKFLEEKKKTRA